MNRRFVIGLCSAPGVLDALREYSERNLFAAGNKKAVFFEQFGDDHVRAAMAQPMSRELAGAGEAVWPGLSRRVSRLRLQRINPGESRLSRA